MTFFFPLPGNNTNCQSKRLHPPLPGVATTVREKALTHPSREIRVLAKELVDRWIAIFKRQKAQRLVQQRSDSPKLVAPAPASVQAAEGLQENGGVKAEEKEGEEAAKPLSEAELALKKAAEEAEAAALAAEEVGLSAIVFGSG